MANISEGSTRQNELATPDELNDFAVDIVASMVSTPSPDLRTILNGMERDFYGRYGSVRIAYTVIADTATICIDELLQSKLRDGEVVAARWLEMVFRGTTSQEVVLNREYVDGGAEPIRKSAVAQVQDLLS